MEVKDDDLTSTQGLDRISGCVFSRSSLKPLFSDDRNEPYPIASVTKTFTAWCCLLPETRPFLNKPFREVLPWFSLRNENVAREMTPRDALSHLSGLEPQTDSWIRSTQSRRDYLEEYLPRFDVAANYKDVHRYSNVMYAVLGLWLEEVTGRSWEELIDAKIREPFKLSSLHHLEPGWDDECPPPFALVDGKLKQIPPFFSCKNHPIAPASELRCTMSDLARWGQIHLDLDPDDERWRPHSFVTDKRHRPEFGPLYYGLGWRLDTVHGVRRVWHTGQCSGYTTLLSLYPDLGMGCALATNRSAATEALHDLDIQFLHTNQTL